MLPLLRFTITAYFFVSHTVLYGFVPIYSITLSLIIMSTYFYSPIHHPSIFTSLIYLQRCHIPDPSGKTHVFRWGFRHSYSPTAQFVRLELFLPLPSNGPSASPFIIALHSCSLSLYILIHYPSATADYSFAILFTIPLRPHSKSL